MKSKLLFLPMLLVLTACGAVHQAQLNAASQRAQQEIQGKCSFYMNVSPKEARAWIAAGEQSQQCSAGISEPWPKDKMMEISQCFTDILNGQVKPVAYSGTAFQKYMDDRINSHKEYADGKIGWDELGIRSAERMQNYFKNGKGGSYFSFASCGNEVLAREVMPTYQHKPLLTEYMANMSAFARKADKEHMEPEDFAVGAQQVWSDFTSKEQGVISQYQAQNAATWQQAVQNMATMQQIENQRVQAQRDSMPKNTNCNVFGNQMNCTTW